MNTNTNLDLRDFIAITAMEASLRTEQAPPCLTEDGRSLSSVSAYDRWASRPDLLASFCYRLADAMLAAREPGIAQAKKEAAATAAAAAAQAEFESTPQGKSHMERLRRLEEASRRAAGLR